MMTTDTTTETTTPELTDAKMIEQIQNFVRRRNDLAMCGEAIVKAIEAGKFWTKTLVVEVDDRFYEIGRTYSQTEAELPIRVTPVTLLK